MDGGKIKKNSKGLFLIVLGIIFMIFGRFIYRSPNFFDRKVDIVGVLVMILGLSCFAWPQNRQGQRNDGGPRAGLVFIGLIYILFAAYLFWIAIGSILSIVYFFVCLPFLAAGFFFFSLTKSLWNFKRWSWYASVAISLVILFGFLWGLFRMQPPIDLSLTGVRVYQISVIVINIAALFYLTLGNIRNEFLGPTKIG